VKRVLVFVAALIVCATARAQSAKPAPQSSLNSKQSPKCTATGEAKSQLKDVKTAADPSGAPLVLKDAGALSTEDVARRAARALAARKDGRTGASVECGTNNAVQKPSPAQFSAAESGSDAVLEFQPASAGSGEDLTSSAVIDGKRRGATKRVHGEIYGETGRAGHATGEGVGVTSKTGKTSVFVQSEQSKDVTSPQP